MRAADVEDAEERGARVRDRQRRQQGGEQDEDERDGETPRRRSRAPPATGLDASPHGRGEVGRLRDVELPSERDECPLELGHPSITSRSRASARAVRDFTVPRRMPSTVAVSSSESSRK